MFIFTNDNSSDMVSYHLLPHVLKGAPEDYEQWIEGELLFTHNEHEYYWELIRKRETDIDEILDDNSNSNKITFITYSENVFSINLGNK